MLGFMQAADASALPADTAGAPEPGLLHHQPALLYVKDASEDMPVRVVFRRSFVVDQSSGRDQPGWHARSHVTPGDVNQPVGTNNVKLLQEQQSTTQNCLVHDVDSTMN